MDKRKEEIIELATRRFLHYGFSKTTMNEIADDVKITKANLYYYYPDKNALIKDVLVSISEAFLDAVEAKVAKYNGDFLDTLFELLRFRAEHMRKHYMVYINENLDWIKDAEFKHLLKNFETRDLSILKSLIVKAVDSGTLKMDNIDESTVVLRRIIKGISLNHTVNDIIHCIPNIENIDQMLEDQIKAVELIFKERIVTNK